jgi:hypothetical protein
MMHSPIDPLGSALLNATLLKLKAEKASALANLSILISARVGVAGHTDVVQDIIDQVGIVARTENSIAVVNAVLNQSS